MDFKVNDIVVDFKATFGNNFGVLDVEEKAVYKDNKKTNETYFTTIITCLDKRMKRFSIKSSTPFVATPPENDIIPVTLVNAVAKPYVMNNQLGFTVTVDDIKVIKD